MKKLLLSGLVLIIINFSSFSQSFLDKMKEKASESVKDMVESVTDIDVNGENVNEVLGSEERIAKLRSKQLEKDTSNYNYIFSQGNRASFFTNRESTGSAVLMTAEKSVTDIDQELHEQVFEFNRLGEFSMYVRPQIASLNFMRAFGLITNEPLAITQSIDSQFSFRSLVDIDTMTVPEKYALGKTMANISIMLHSEGKHNLSQGFMAETIQYFEDVFGMKSLALTSLYNNYAVIVQSLGKYTEAEEYFDRCQALIAEEDKTNSLSHAIMTSNRALLYNEVGQYKEANASIEKAMNMASGELREKGRDNVSFVINQGLIYYSMGNYEAAEKTFKAVMTLKRKRMATNQTDYANVENYLASVLMELGKTDKVPELLNDALEVFAEKYDKNHPAYIKTLHNLGLYNLYIGNYEEAHKLIKEVNQTYFTFFGEYHPDYLKSLEDLAVLSWKLGDFSKATAQFKQVITSLLELVEKNFGAMSEYEKGQYWAKVRPSILKFHNYAVAKHKTHPQLMTEMYNIQLKTKGILFGASTRIREQILTSSNASLKKVYLDWKTTKEDLLLHYTYSKSQLEELGIDVDREEEKANQLEKQLSKMSADFTAANKLPNTTMDEVQATLSSTEAAIEIIAFPKFENSFTSEKRYAFLIVTANNPHPRLVVVENGNDLDGKYAAAYRNMIRMKINNQPIYDQYWGLVDEALGDATNIHMSLDGVFYQVSIGTLMRPDNQYVSDVQNIHFYASTRDLVNQKVSTHSNKNATFIGFPDYGDKGLLAALPGTKDEINTVKNITKNKGYGISVMMEKEASEENFKKVSSPSLLHIATHGFFLEESHGSNEKVFGVAVNQAKDNPLLRSGLMLSDAEESMGESSFGSNEAITTNNGILTAYEVLTLDLKNTDLVILSACETGLGEIKSGEGVYGLQRAFQVAGAKSVIMSLWKVSDEATKKLMVLFYNEWMQGKEKNAAFLSAQRQLRQEFVDPYYWGAFMMLN